MPAARAACFVLADGEPEIADAAAQKKVAQREGGDRRGEDDVIEHGRRAAQPPQIVVGVLGDRQEQAARGVDEVEMIEADARKLGEGDGQDGEIDAGDAEAEGEIADHRAAGRARPGSRRESRATARRRSARTKIAAT